MIEINLSLQELSPKQNIINPKSPRSNMFGSLKNKLKGWLKKTKAPEEDSDKPKEIKVKKVKAKIKDKDKKEKKVLPKKIQEATIPKPKKEKPTKEEDQEEELSPSLKETIETPVKEKGFFSKFKKKLSEEKFEELFQELQMILLQNNVAFEVVEQIKNTMEEKLLGKSISDVNIEKELKKAIESVLIDSPNIIEEIKSTLEVKKPVVIIFVGINGSGKTTTIAKFANLLKKQKISVCLAAADTFRAAAIQQLEEHANKLDVPIIKKDYGVDPAAVGFEAVAYAKKHHIDVVLIDTAGRMNTKESLMKEMEKINRVSNADMRIFIGESITGNDATEQAQAFNKIIDLSGIILSKADVDEKGGTAISVSHVTKKPILFLGTGQTYDDLTPFNKDELLNKLFG
jgi:fused signal recognition particle receptor